MEERIINQKRIQQFSQYLAQEEKSAATVEKYLRDVQAFHRFVEGRPVNKELVIAYKKQCMEQGYAVRSINSMLASINSFLGFMGWLDCKVKSIRLQRQVYSTEEKELTKDEYLRLLEASRGKEQLNLVLQTICGTGIRVSELRYFTLEMVRTGTVTVNCKSKTRTILVPGKLRKLLVDYAKRNKIAGGVIFRGKNGRPLDRSSIWRQMKQLCRQAGVSESKVFPIICASCLLGHSTVSKRTSPSWRIFWATAASTPREAIL